MTASGMASRMPGSRIRKTLTLLGLIVLIIHCRPWSYALFEPVPEGEQDAQGACECDFAEPPARKLAVADVLEHT
jgi:hypothetical protein